MRTTFYVTNGRETLEDIAKKTGISYSVLANLNPRWRNDEIPYKTRLLIATSTVKNLKEYSSSSKQKTSSASSQTKTASAGGTTSSSIAKALEEARKNAIKKQQYEDDISEAEEKYENDLALLDNSYSQKRRKLASTLRENKQKLASSLAAQKITSSSIAENEKQALASSSDAEENEMKKEYEIKAEKLENTREKAKRDADRKIQMLG